MDRGATCVCAWGKYSQPSEITHPIASQMRWRQSPVAEPRRYPGFALTITSLIRRPSIRTAECWYSSTSSLPAGAIAARRGRNMGWERTNACVAGSAIRSGPTLSIAFSRLPRRE